MSGFGDWPSPLSAAAAAAGGLRLGDLRTSGDSAWWVEMRPAESGRGVIVRWDGGTCHDVLPAPWSARSEVHEYGGGAFAADADDVVFSAADRGLYRLTAGATEPVPLCRTEGWRFADMVFDRARARVICVVEDHAAAGGERSILAGIPLDGGEPQVLAEGPDFCAAPRISADGTRIAWITWDLPAMPWDETSLRTGVFAKDGSIAEARVVTDAHESALAPLWSPGGVLHFVSDRGGWWNLHREDAGGVRNLAPLNADCAWPAWVFGQTPFAFLSAGGIAFAAVEDGIWSLRVIAPDGSVSRIETPGVTELSGHVCARGDTVVCDGGGPSLGPSVIGVDPATEETRIIRRSSDLGLGDAYISHGEPFSFSSGAATAYGVLYRPRNSDVTAPDAPPPLIVRAHGGPTSSAGTSLDPTVQFFTTRGFAFCDVNYRGSTGHGRAYRHALYGECGVADVADCLAAARHLAGRGEADADACFIRGGSAGGHIALLAVCGQEVFGGCTSLFGVADPRSLAADTHRFESRYYDVLIGPLPEAAARYDERSPLNRCSEISVPVLLLQGLDDRIVPPSQTEAMFAALAGRGVPVAALFFEGEGHGFRRAATVERVLETELWFYRRLLGHAVATPAGLRTANL